MSTFLILAAVYLLPTALIAAWVVADRWLDRRWDAEPNPPLQRTPDPFEEHVSEALALGSTTPIGDATAAHLAAQAAAGIDDEWHEMQR